MVRPCVVISIFCYALSNEQIKCQVALHQYLFQARPHPTLYGRRMQKTPTTKYLAGRVLYVMILQVCLRIRHIKIKNRDDDEIDNGSKIDNNLVLLIYHSHFALFVIWSSTSQSLSLQISLAILARRLYKQYPSILMFALFTHTNSQ